MKESLIQENQTNQPLAYHKEEVLLLKQQLNSQQKNMILKQSVQAVATGPTKF
jgi:hypothetical protein